MNKQKEILNAIEMIQEAIMDLSTDNPEAFSVADQVELLIALSKITHQILN